MAYHHIFWSNIEVIRSALLLNEEKFSSYIDIGVQEYLNFKHRQEILPLRSLITLGIRLSIDYNLFFDDRFDINQIYLKLSSGKKLKEKYTIGTFTKPIVIMNTLNHIERVKGVRAKAEIMEGFDLDLGLLMKSDTRLNIHLNKDILNFIRARYKLELSFFQDMGSTLAENLKDSAMANNISSQKNISQMLEYFVLECTPNFDENFRYSLKSLNQDFALIEASPNKDVLEELEISPLVFGSDPADYNRMGFFSAVSHFHFRQFTKIRRISDLLIGDKTSTYLLDLRPFKEKNFNLIK